MLKFSRNYECALGFFSVASIEFQIFRPMLSILFYFYTGPHWISIVASSLLITAQFASGISNPVCLLTFALVSLIVTRVRIAFLIAAPEFASAFVFVVLLNIARFHRICLGPFPPSSSGNKNVAPGTEGIVPWRGMALQMNCRIQCVKSWALFSCWQSAGRIFPMAVSSAWKPHF